MPLGPMRAEFCHEIMEFQSKVRSFEATAVALDAGRFAASVSTIALDDVAVEILRAPPLLLIGMVAEQRPGCLVVLEGARAARWDGEALGARDVALLSPGASLSLAFPERWACAFVSADVEQGEALPLLDAPGRSDRQEPLRIRRSAFPAHRRFAAFLEEIEANSAALHNQGCEEMWRSLRASLLEALQRLLEPGGQVATWSRRRGTAARQRLVHLADEYFRANMARPIYTEELCVALGASASVLHEAFREAFGVSPHRYLKLRRMGIVRATLLSRRGQWHSVKAAALSHGFWHLGQFAHDYRSIFGELPSDTLERARL